MIRRFRLCFPLVGLLFMALLLANFQLRAQVRPVKTGEAPPPSTRR